MSEIIKLNKMENKITKEELKKIQELQGSMNQSLAQVGLLEAQKHSLLHSVADLNKEVEENKASLEEKYGSVQINLEDGSYKEIEVEEDK